MAVCRSSGFEVEHLERDDDRRPRQLARADEVDRAERQRARQLAERVVDEHAADVVVRQQQLDEALHGRGIVVRNVDQVRPAVGRDDRACVGAVRTANLGADEPVANHRVIPRAGAGIDRHALVETAAFGVLVRIEEVRLAATSRDRSRGSRPAACPSRCRSCRCRPRSRAWPLRFRWPVRCDRSRAC